MAVHAVESSNLLESQGIQRISYPSFGVDQLRIFQIPEFVLELRFLLTKSIVHETMPNTDAKQCKRKSSSTTDMPSPTLHADSPSTDDSRASNPSAHEHASELLGPRLAHHAIKLTHSTPILARIQDHSKPWDFEEKQQREDKRERSAKNIPYKHPPHLYTPSPSSFQTPSAHKSSHWAHSSNSQDNT